MTDEQIVKEKYPNAYSRYNALFKWYVIITGIVTDGVDIIARDRNEQAAWHSAAEKINDKKEGI